MERRALIAVVISLVILLGYEQVMRHFLPQAARPESSAETPSPPPEAAANQPLPPPEATELSSPKPAVAERLITVDTPLYVATITTNGGRLIHFQLKNYRTTVDVSSPPLETVSAASSSDAPIGVELRGPQGVAVLTDAGAPYSTDRDKLTLQGSEEGTLDLTWATPNLTVRKRLTFRADGYEISGNVDVSNIPAGYNELLLAWPRTVDQKPAPGTEVLFDKAVFLNAKKRIEHAFSDLDKGLLIEGDIRWTGYSGSHFFSGLAIDESRNQRLWLKQRGSIVDAKLLIPISGTAVQAPVELYIGPKDVDSLEKAGHNFARAVDLGWFGFIAVPLLHVLQLSHRFTGNYGIDIILLTVVIKILFIPLTRSSFKSMQAMQKLQPQMQKIREKMKDTPEEMNKEIMELYRRHKVNPFGGCLPMLLQIPVFIGLYTALMNTVELRHAPFMLWINDLAAPDRLGSIQLPFVQHPGIPVLTLLMGASMFLQQWMTPSMGDPSQRQVMMLMPLMFTFMFVNFPSGLSLYWLVNNVLTIAQQYSMNRSQPKRGG